MIRWFIEVNRRACRAFDRLLPKRFSIDGNREFLTEIAPSYLTREMKVVDVGGGRHPFVRIREKENLALKVTGMDISVDELRAAPAGAYDEVVVGDITSYRGRQEADVVICQAVLEHVSDTEGAFKSLESLTRPGGRILLFVPSRNAAFARLNLLIPQGIKRHLLFYLYPETRSSQGFASFYNRCTPRDFSRLANAVGLTVEREVLYWSSAYFTFFLPLHILWRLSQGLMMLVLGRQAAETFSMILLKSKSDYSVT